MLIGPDDPVRLKVTDPEAWSTVIPNHWEESVSIYRKQSHGAPSMTFRAAAAASRVQWLARLSVPCLARRLAVGPLRIGCGVSND